MTAENRWAPKIFLTWTYLLSIRIYAGKKEGHIFDRFSNFFVVLCRLNQSHGKKSCHFLTCPWIYISWRFFCRVNYYCRPMETQKHLHQKSLKQGCIRIAQPWHIHIYMHMCLTSLANYRRFSTLALNRSHFIIVLCMCNVYGYITGLQFSFFLFITITI